MNLGSLAHIRGAQAIETTHDPLFNTLGHVGVDVVLVHGGDVVEAVLTLLEHAAHAVLNNDRQLIGVSRVITDAIGHRCRHQVTVSILMLEALTIERRAPRGRANQETPGLTVSRRPGEIANTLKTKHGVEDVKGHHRKIRHAVGRRRCQPGRERARLVDTLLQDLARLGLFVVEDPAGIMRRIALPHRRVDPHLPEHSLHSEGARFIRDDGNDTITQTLVFQQR